MSTHVRCPICDRAAANVAHPDERWGQIFDGRELNHAADLAAEPSSDDFRSCLFPWTAGRETFECACGRAIWIGDRLMPDGHWFTNPALLKEPSHA